MSKLDIELEIHRPGLNLHSTRWNFHVLFLEEIEAHFEYVAAIAWDQHTERGRGALFVSDDQWMELIRRDWTENGEEFPCEYFSPRTALDEMDLGPISEGFTHLLETYDPERQVVLCVRHRPGIMVSCYLFSCSPTPPECYQHVYVSKKDRDIDFSSDE